MLYNDILLDTKLIDYLKTIDEKHDANVFHGLNHALGVVHNAELLGVLLQLDDETINCLKIAALLHDTGMIDGKDNHPLKGAQFAYKYLAGKIDDKWVNTIYNAILHHHEKEDITSLPLFEHILLYADKSDVTKKRIDDIYCEKNNLPLPFGAYITDLKYEIVDKTFILTYYLSEAKKIDTWDYFIKLDKRTKEFADKLGLAKAVIRTVVKIDDN